MLQRLASAVAVMRPRALARMAADVARLDGMADTVRNLSADVGKLRRQAKADRSACERQARSTEALLRQVADLTSSIETLTRTVASVQSTVQKADRRAEQISTVLQADAIDERQFEALSTLLQPQEVADHVRAAIARSPLQTDPFPHLVVENLLPDRVYDALVTAIPPRILFEDRPVNKQQLKVPPQLAPRYSRRVWKFLISEVVEKTLKPALLEKFREPLGEYLARFWPHRPTGALLQALGASDGRIILRRAGYVIPPHRDPRWGFITVILYLVRPGDPDTWGTQLYRVREDAEATSAQPYWIKDVQCELVKDVPFRPNRALVFMNSEGAHGASIPAEAPADFERYIYQWRIGAHGALMQDLLAELTPEARRAWEGKEGY
jgi:hypothetical protein